MVNKRRFLDLMLLASVFVLTSCASVTREEQDSAPARPIDISNVKDAVPVPVRRTIAGNKSPYTVLGKTYSLLAESTGYREQGIASWYGQKFHGRNTSNGEVYNMYAMTAAHKTLPIPSYVRVTNVANQRSIVVKVNDRGPFHANRIIDLSYAGAVKLGFVNNGTARVLVEDVTPLAVVATPKMPEVPSSQGLYDYLQLGAFSQRVSADELKSQLASLFSLPVLVTSDVDRLYRVKMGPLDNNLAVDDIQRILLQNGINKGYVVQRGNLIE